jgi:hypothetical protein
MCPNHIGAPVGRNALDRQGFPDVVAPGSDPRPVNRTILRGTSGAGIAISNLDGTGTINSGSTVGGSA